MVQWDDIYIALCSFLHITSQGATGLVLPLLFLLLWGHWMYLGRLEKTTQWRWSATQVPPFILTIPSSLTLLWWQIDNQGITYLGTVLSSPLHTAYQLVPTFSTVPIWGKPTYCYSWCSQQVQQAPLYAIDSSCPACEQHGTKPIGFLCICSSSALGSCYGSRVAWQDGKAHVIHPQK